MTVDPVAVRRGARAIQPLVQRHAEDAAFYWARHADASNSTEHDWRSQRRMAHLLEANLEGLRVAQVETGPAPGAIGDAAWTASKARLARWGTSDESFVAGTLALHALEFGVSAWLEELQALGSAQFERGQGDAIARGLACAAAYCGDGLAERVAIGWWDSARAPWPLAGLIAARNLPSVRQRFVQEALGGGASSAVVAEAARLAGAVGMTESIPALAAALDQPGLDLETRSGAAAAIGRMVSSKSERGDAWRQAEAALLDVWTTAPEQLHDDALIVLLWRADQASTNRVIEQMLRDGVDDRRRWREALRAIRFQGDARWLPVLLQSIEHQSRDEEVQRYFSEPSSNLARLAGDVFAHLTGARIGEQRWREAPEARDEELDEVLGNPYVPASAKRDPDGSLLWPDAAKLKEQWPGMSPGFEVGRRYLAGERVVEGTLLRCLGNARATQQQRAQAALLLQLARGPGPCFDVSLPSAVQDRELVDLGVTSWNW